MDDELNLPLDITAANVSAFVPTRHDIAFTHSVFAQCFLPLRKLGKGAKSYETRHGKASIAIDAGRFLNPKTGALELQDVPYGSAARIGLAHINNHVIRARSLDEAQEVPMGESLRDFFRNHRLTYGGKNGNQIRKQIANISAARMTIGIWQDNQAKQINVPTLAEEIDFWLENDKQPSLWQPTMILNRRYVETIRERRVPLDMRALIGLYEKTRAMDIFTWLSYRLPSVEKKTGVFIPYFGEDGLHDIFGQSVSSPRKFRQVFHQSLREACAYYPDARVSPERDGIRVFNSLSPVPPEHSISQGKSIFFVDKPRG